MPDHQPLPRPAAALSAAAPVPQVSVIVPVYNDAAALRSLLQALAAQDLGVDRFECLVVDNGSDPPLEIPPLTGLQVRLLRESRAGSYAARNRGVQEARGEVLAFTDADCLPRPDWLSSAVRRLSMAERPLILAGRLEVCRATSTRDSALGWHSVVNDLDQARFVANYHFAATANMITTAEVFRRVGPFDPALYSGGDFEWGRRAWASGIEQVYCEEMVVQHPARADWSALVAKTRRIAGGHFALHRRAGRPLAAALRTTLQVAASSFGRSCRDPRLPSAACRLRVVALDLLLRSIQFGEVVRLWLGGRPSRR
jgi:glycosyltransferase involved in cell wall biosynthesis